MRKKKAFVELEELDLFNIYVLVIFFLILIQMNQDFGTLRSHSTHAQSWRREMFGWIFKNILYYLRLLEI